MQLALELDYYLHNENLHSGYDADSAMWLMDTLVTSLDFFAEAHLVECKKASDCHSPYWSGYCGGNSEQVHELKDLIIRAYKKNEDQRFYDHVYAKGENTQVCRKPMDDRSNAVLMTSAPDSWYE